MCLCWLEDEGGHMAKKWEPQSYYCKKLNSANKLNESGLHKEPSSANLDFDLVPEQRT